MCDVSMTIKCIIATKMELQRDEWEIMGRNVALNRRGKVLMEGKPLISTGV